MGLIRPDSIYAHNGNEAGWPVLVISQAPFDREFPDMNGALMTWGIVELILVETLPFDALGICDSSFL